MNILGSEVTPVGAVVAYAGTLGAPLPSTASPTTKLPKGEQDHTIEPIEAWGWMLCDGRELVASEYPHLFAALGHLYGASDDKDKTKFRIPDYRGYFLRCIDAGADRDKDKGERTPPAGSSEEEQVGSTQEYALQSHKHSYTKPNDAVTPYGSDGGASAVPSVSMNECTGDPKDTCTTDVRVSENETRPMNIYVNYIIKFTYGPGHTPFPKFSHNRSL